MDDRSLHRVLPRDTAYWRCQFRSSRFQRVGTRLPTRWPSSSTPSEQMRLPSSRPGQPAAVNRYLLPHEHQVITVRKHPAILIGPSIEALAGLLVAAVLTATILHGNDPLVFVVWIAWIALFLRMVWKTVNWAVDFFVVTSQRMLLTTGVLTRKVAMMPLAKVTDMSFRRSFAGRLFGYGEFIVESAGQDQAFRIVDHIPYPEQHIWKSVGCYFRAARARPPRTPRPGRTSPTTKPATSPLPRGSCGRTIDFGRPAARACPGREPYGGVMRSRTGCGPGEDHATPLRARASQQARHPDPQSRRRRAPLS